MEFGLGAFPSHHLHLTFSRANDAKRKSELTDWLLEKTN